jgi:hypothetical protein
MSQANTGKRRSKSRFEFLAAFILLSLAGFGGYRCIVPILAGNQANDKSGSSILGQQLLQNEHFSLDSHAPNRSVPERYRIQGTVDERYTVASDPRTGEMIIQDSLGSLGANSTSIEGDRALLAKNMVDLQQYIDTNRNSLPADAYNWLRQVARSGIALAFGAPGYPADAQGTIKSQLLDDFHTISSNPPPSMLQTDKYLSLESVFSPAETAYQNTYQTVGTGQSSGQSTTNFLAADPISAPDKSWNPQYYDEFTNQTLSTLYTPPLSTLANTPESATSTSGSASGNSSISGTTPAANSGNANTPSPGNPITVADYYQTTLGSNVTNAAGSTASASAANIDTSLAIGTVLTTVTVFVYTNGTLTSSTSTTTTSSIVLDSSASAN